MTLDELKNIIVKETLDILTEAGPGYRDTATPEFRPNNLRNVGRNPLAVDHGNHGGSLDATSTPSTIDWNGAKFNADKVIPLNNNRLTFYKIKNFGNDKYTSSLDFFTNETDFRKAIDTIYGAAQRNGGNVKFRTIIPAEKPPRKNSLVRTFWEYSFDGGHTWYIMKPNPSITMQQSSLKENKDTIKSNNIMGKKVIRLTESELKKVITNSVKKIIKEQYGGGGERLNKY